MIFPAGTTKVLPAPAAGPPRAPLAFRVGVVGHRPNRLRQADLNQLTTTLRQLLEIVKTAVDELQRDEPNLFENRTATLRAISPLAEGVDRLFATQALAAGYELCCVFPFAQSEYEKDFALEKALDVDSLPQFRELVANATTRFELDGTRNDEAGAYGTAGKTVLHQSDLLLVIWDGEWTGKRGGTEETLEDARQAGVPVVWIDAHAPHAWKILAHPRKDWPPTKEPSLNSDGQAVLQGLVRFALLVPEATFLASESRNSHRMSAEFARQGVADFYRERLPSWTTAVVWNAFRDLLGDYKRPQLQFSIGPFRSLESSTKENPPSPSLSQFLDGMHSYYAWLDRLSVIYADRYRSGFIVSFLLAACAVWMALLPLGFRLAEHGILETVCITLELLAIVIILGLVSVGRRFRWHGRWLDYRLAAELLRHLRIVSILGGAPPFPHIPAHWASYGQPGSTWMAWYVRSLARSLGLPSVTVNNRYLAGTLEQLSNILEEQIRYHDITARRCDRIERTLHATGITLLLLTLIACGTHLLPIVSSSVHLPEWMPPLLTFVCGFLPAMGAALAGIINQGEFRRIEKRSDAMHDQLHKLKGELEDLRQEIGRAGQVAGRQFSVRAVELAQDAANLLLHEVLDWRVVLLDRPFVPPS